MGQSSAKEPWHQDVERVLLSAQDISKIVTRMGKEITADYRDRNPLIVAVLKGAIIFVADLMRAIDCPLEVDFMAVSSYGSAAKSSGVVRIVKDLDTSIEGRDVLVVEDILDSGVTLKYLIRNLKSRGPKSVEIAAFLVKDVPGHKPAVTPRYVGTHVPNDFVVGYGLDFNERYRNLPYLGILKPEVYS